MSFLQYVLWFVIALGVLIVVHEYGHYLVARLCGVKVLRFSVGFGRPLLLWRLGRDRTEWVLAAVPFGGYVKMLDEREGPVEPAELPRAFNRQGVSRRFLIVAAGPVFNFLFAIAVYAGLYMHGLPEARPVLAAPAAGTRAAQAGFAAGDLVRAISGESIATWQDLRWRVLQGALQRETLRFEVADARGGIAERTLELRDYPSEEVESDTMERLGLRLFRRPLDPVIGQLAPGSAAERAGLQPNDRVTRIGGKPMATWEDLVREVRRSAGKRLVLTIQRGEVTTEVAVTPDAVTEKGETFGRLGAIARAPSTQDDKIVVKMSYGPVPALGKAIVKTWDISIFSLKMLGKMLVGEVSWKHLSGPVTIAEYAGQSAQLGWIPFVLFLALISISLGVLNLLPIPLLDGGHLMYYAVEIIKGSPVSERAMELGQRAGLALLLVIMAFALYNDLNRVLTG
ncbi:MAG TPA: RIP metalloprotease RseP [Burkholderiales bacterium]|jgi:regulator of sigma E protease|nr:RIP metalloprotease RseP [Burkholderiales bacterium]